MFKFERFWENQHISPGSNQYLIPNRNSEGDFPNLIQSNQDLISYIDCEVYWDCD